MWRRWVKEDSNSGIRAAEIPIKVDLFEYLFIYFSVRRQGEQWIL
jgi:hypothetical protein